MILKRLNLLPFFLVMVFGIAVISCSDDDGTEVPEEEEQVEEEEEEEETEPETESVTRFFTGVQYGTDPSVEVLLQAESLTEGTISPVGNGFEQPAWMVFIGGPDEIIAGGYTSAPEYTRYSVEDGALTKGASFLTADDMFSATVVDESTMVMLACPWFNFGDKFIYVVDTDNMEVVDSAVTILGDIDLDGDGDIYGEDDTEEEVSMPTGMHVRGDYLYIAYYMTKGDFSTPNANEALIAVFTYPGLEYVKTISDNRASNISRYYAFNGIQEADNGDLYTFSSSALVSGYFPAPENNSAVLRIKNGETDFDPDYYLDFETASGGLKIFDMFYTSDDKAVVLASYEDEADSAFWWGGYQGGGAFTVAPVISTGILDLVTGQFTLLSEVPLSGGDYKTGAMVDGSKVYLAIHNTDYQGIYMIDTETGTATEGASIDGNHAKGIFSITTEEVVE